MTESKWDTLIIVPNSTFISRIILSCKSQSMHGPRGDLGEILSLKIIFQNIFANCPRTPDVYSENAFSKYTLDVVPFVLKVQTPVLRLGPWPGNNVLLKLSKSILSFSGAHKRKNWRKWNNSYQSHLSKKPNQATVKSVACKFSSKIKLTYFKNHNRDFLPKSIRGTWLTASIQPTIKYYIKKYTGNRFKNVLSLRI